MIIYFLIFFCLFFAVLNFVILIIMGNSLLKFYEYCRTNFQKNDQKIISPNSKRTPDKGLVDLNEVGTYDARFQIDRK